MKTGHGEDVFGASLILNLVLGVLILFVCKRDKADISRTPSHCGHTVTYYWYPVYVAWYSWYSLDTNISIPIRVSFGLLPFFRRAQSLHWKIIQQKKMLNLELKWLLLLCMLMLPCMNCKYWLTCGFTLLEHTSFDHSNGREGNVCQRESLVNMSRPIWELKIIVIEIISHSPTWLFMWTCKDTFSWTDLIFVFRFSFYVNYLPNWLQGYLNF